MSPLEAIRTALGAIVAHKMRSALTVLGIVIGVAAVVSLMSVGKGAQATIASRIQSLGTNLVFVRPGAVNQGGVNQGQGSSVRLTLNDAYALADPSLLPSVALVAPAINTMGQVVASGQNMRTRMVGVTPEYQYAHSYTVADGSFITQEQVDGNSLVAVLGSNVASTLFPDADPIGQSLRINNRSFRVVGVLASLGGTSLGLQDDQVLVPLTTAFYRLSGGRTPSGGVTVQQIDVQVADQRVMTQAKDEIAAALRERHQITGEDDFTITSQEDMISTLSETTQVLTILLGAIAGISLLVGGIGIMNIMLVSVTERTREIGLRKALGAKRRDIMSQFVMEATTLSLTGGVVGLAVGWGMSRIIAGYQLGNQVLQTVVTPDIMALAFLTSAAIGLFFGIYPAFRASSLDPIEALRHE